MQTRQKEAAPSRPVEEAAVPKQLPVSTPDELQEELCQQNTGRHNWIEQLGAQDRRVTSRGYQRMADYLVGTTDPDATLMETTKGADMGYRTHYVVDGGKARIILGVLATPSEVMDNQPMRDLIFRARSRCYPSPFSSSSLARRGILLQQAAKGSEIAPPKRSGPLSSSCRRNGRRFSGEHPA